MEDTREAREERHAQKEDSFRKCISVEDPTEKEKKKTDHSMQGWRCPDPNCRKLNPKEAENCGQCKLSSKMAKDRDGRRGGRWGGGRGGRGGRGGNSHGGGRGGGGGSAQRRIPDDVDAANPVVVQFIGYSHILDDRHDRHERIVKMGRDITIESKRIIFALHRIKTDKDKPCVLGEAEMRLGTVRKNLWRNVAFELKDVDDWLFLRGYSAGLQEYIEALSLYHYLCYDKVISWKAVQDELSFQVRRRRKWEDKGKKNEERIDEVKHVHSQEVIVDVTEVKEVKKTPESMDVGVACIKDEGKESDQIVEGVKERATNEDDQIGNKLKVNIKEADSIILDKIEKKKESVIDATAEEKLFKCGEKIKAEEEEILENQVHNIEDGKNGKSVGTPQDIHKDVHSHEVTEDMTEVKEVKIPKSMEACIKDEGKESDQIVEGVKEMTSDVDDQIGGKIKVNIKEPESIILDKIEKNEESLLTIEATKIDDPIKTKENKEDADEFETLMVTVPQTDYILGLADLTGELMRNAINSVAAGNTEACFSLLNLLQQINEGFAKIDKTLIPRHVERKLEEFKRSLRKVEDACYAINVRGSELPKDHLGNVFDSKTDDGYHAHSRDPIEELYFGE